MPVRDEERRDKIETAEFKLSKLFEKRNERNQLAREARGERDALNEKRREILDAASDLRDKRDEINGKIQEHKRQRDILQQKAKTLIKKKKGLLGERPDEARARLSQLKEEIADMEQEHQIRPMDPGDEREFIDKLKEKQAEAERLKTIVGEAMGVEDEIGDVDEEIDRLFNEADEHHAKVVELSEKGQAVHEKLEPVYEQADRIKASADERHREAMEIQERANHYHERAVELIQELEELRGEEEAEKEQIEAYMEEQKERADEALEMEEEDFDALMGKLKEGEKLSF